LVSSSSYPIGYNEKIENQEKNQKKEKIYKPAKKTRQTIFLKEALLLLFWKKGSMLIGMKKFLHKELYELPTKRKICSEYK
jgi:hypothetical protein